MELQLLPPYHGLPDSPRAWGEPDQQGLLPGMRLRDYLVLLVLITITAPMLIQFVIYMKSGNQTIDRLDAARRHQSSQEASRDLRNQPGIKR